jgi:hypothetical protein
MLFSRSEHSSIERLLSSKLSGNIENENIFLAQMNAIANPMFSLTTTRKTRRASLQSSWDRSNEPLVPWGLLLFLRRALSTRTLELRVML